MAKVVDMSAPVTRGELREELAKLATKTELELAKLATRTELELAKLATRTELEVWGGALLARIESGEKRIGELIGRTEQRLLDELARHTRANHEATLTLLAAIDDKYADLPERTRRLEARVFPPEEH
jgi:hypothetical protein